jgi:hypothetical protein
VSYVNTRQTLVHRRVVESPLDSEPAANFAFASPLVLVPL